jgi:hypothetical protein
MFLEDIIQKLRIVLREEGCQVDDVGDLAIMTAARLLEESILTQEIDKVSDVSFPIPK